MGKMKPVELFVYESNESLGVFSCSQYLEDNSETLFGKKVLANKLNLTTKSKKQAYGLYVRFITEQEYNSRKHNENNVSLLYEIKEKQKKEKPKNKWIDTSKLPKKMWNGKESIDWLNSEGFSFTIHYNDIIKDFDIIKVEQDEEKRGILTLKYDKNKERKMSTSQILSLNFGDVLGVSKNNGQYMNEFKYNVGDIIDNIQITDRKIIVHRGLKERAYKYKCLKCGYECGEGYDVYKKTFILESWILERNIIKGHRCSCCSSIIIVKNINSAYAYDKSVCDFLKNKEDSYIYSNGSGIRLLFKCPRCGCEKHSTFRDFFEKGFSCPSCGDGISYPNKFMYKVLSKLNINFTTEYCPKWAKGKRYDFYLPDYKLIIEMDGGFHYNDNHMSGQTRNESEKIDNFKDKVALKHDLYVIRINCNYRYIEKSYEIVKDNLMSSPLNIIFDLSKINLDECDLYSKTNSIMLEICKIKRNKSDITIKEIREMFLPERRLGTGTIMQYLKTGNELGLCDYKARDGQFYSKDNPVGVKQKKNGNWMATISINNKSRNKTFKTKEEAIQQRLEWEKEREEIHKNIK